MKNIDFKKTFIQHYLKKILCLLLTIVFAAQCSIPAFAATPAPTTPPTPTSSGAFPDAQKQVFQDGILYFDASNPCQLSGGASGNGSGVTGSTKWNSSVAPPYYLEEYVIDILQDLAQAENVPTSQTVTQEHVVALIAWAYAEGGNIANSGAFNIWNTGLTSRPDLVQGGTNASGLQSFVSYNAGVEANVISITGSNQNRIGNILTQSSSTAEQVVHAIAYYDETSGNKAWAWGPSPNDPNAVLQFNHTTYITSLTDQLHTVRSNYKNLASVVIGPGEENTHHVNASKLQFSGGSSSGNGSLSIGGSGTCSGSGSTDCTTATGDPKILCEAQKYQGIYYEYGGAHQGFSAFIAGCPDPSNPPNNQPTGGPVNGDPGGLSGSPSPCATDCSGLVSVATDEAFNQTYMWSVAGGVMQGSGAQSWKSISISQAQPGDIVTQTEHVEIVDHVSGNTIYTFGSHDTGSKTGLISSPVSTWNGGAWHWTGTGSSGS